MKTRLNLASIFISVMLCMSSIFPRALFAQVTSGTNFGVVVDQSGAVVSGATITLKHIETGLTRTITTDEGGRYRVPALPLGDYEVKAEHSGFTTGIRSGMELTVGREAEVNFTLAVGKIEETVRITGDASLVETTNPTLGGLVSDRRMRELPLNGRDVWQLTTLQVGVTNAAPVSSGGVLDNGPGTTKIAVNGARPTGNNFLLDGTSVNDAFNKTPGSIAGIFIGVDTIQEFQILTSNYSAEYGEQMDVPESLTEP